jgi:hypothetical protein
MKLRAFAAALLLVESALAGIPTIEIKVDTSALFETPSKLITMLPRAPNFSIPTMEPSCKFISVHGNHT